VLVERANIKQHGINSVDILVLHHDFMWFAAMLLVISRVAGSVILNKYNTAQSQFRLLSNLSLTKNGKANWPILWTNSSCHMYTRIPDLKIAMYQQQCHHCHNDAIRHTAANTTILIKPPTPLDIDICQNLPCHYRLMLHSTDKLLTFVMHYICHWIY